MSESDLYRQYAAECLNFAKQAKTDTERKNFLDLARTWTEAAAQIEDVPPLPPHANQPKSAHH